MARGKKKKRPAKEVKQIKQRSKLEAEVFDERTMKLLSGMIKKGIIDSLDCPVSTGKEANVFRAGREDGFLAVKIYRIETTTFNKIKKYIIGDPRFRNIKRRYDMICEWASKEYANLRICERADVNAPKPVFQKKNIVVMEFLGYEGIPFPTLQDYGTENPKEDLESILGDIRKLYKSGLVHGDLSEYNILVTPNGPYMIDVGQAVVLAHPNSGEFLERDVRIILKYFGKRGVEKDFGETMKWIKS